jgi:hypothetical protein
LRPAPETSGAIFSQRSGSKASARVVGADDGY